MENLCEFLCCSRIVYLQLTRLMVRQLARRTELMWQLEWSLCSVHVNANQAVQSISRALTVLHRQVQMNLDTFS